MLGFGRGAARNSVEVKASMDALIGWLADDHGDYTLGLILSAFIGSVCCLFWTPFLFVGVVLLKRQRRSVENRTGGTG
jgi:hypothetical protein